MTDSNRSMGAMPAKLDTITGHISTQVRAISVGVLAVTWLALSGSEDIKAFSFADTRWLISIGGLCVSALFLDLLQYIAGYWNLELQRLRPGSKCWAIELLRKLRFGAFYAKQISAMAAAAWLVLLIFFRVSAMDPDPPKLQSNTDLIASRLLAVESRLASTAARIDRLTADSESCNHAAPAASATSTGKGELEVAPNQVMKDEPPRGINQRPADSNGATSGR